MDSAVINSGSMSPRTRERHARLYADSSRPLRELVRIEDPAFYVDPWPVYMRLQEEAPVYFHEPFNTWILTRHEDVQLASRAHETFSVRHGKLLYDGLKKDSGIGSLFAGDGDIIGVTDPPRHNELRRIMMAPFTPRAIARTASRIETFCDTLLDRIVPGEPVDWVEAVAGPLPVMVIAAILGVPEDDAEFHRRVREWGAAAEDLASRDLSPAEVEGRKSAFTGLTEFIAGLFDEKRAHPGDDFLSSLLADHLDDERLSQANLVGFAQLLIAAGADTSRAMIAELVAHLAAQQDQRALLVADPGLAPGAVEEVLRYAPPPRGFARQLVQDTDLRGQRLRAGERVWMAFEAANRDAEVFPDPHRFDIRRTEARRNVAFGFGTHVCIAAPLVRMETRILLQKLITRYPRFEMAGPGQRVESFLRNGWNRLPIVFHAA